MIRILSFTFVILGISLRLWAFPATVNDDNTDVFSQPDFESPVLFHLQQGQKIEVSVREFTPKNRMGVFHRIRSEDGKIGFITDAEYTVVNGKPGKNAPKPKLEEKPPQEVSEEHEEVSSKTHRRPFSMTRYRGVTIDYVGYKEQTMGFQPMANVVFYGFRAFGPDLLVSGDMVTEFNVNVLPGAPPFYQEATSNSASGWILHADAIFESIFAQTREVNTYAGFGPMFKYDHYSVSLSSNGKSTPYDLNDMTLGAVFNVGLGLRLGSTCLRTEFKYNWEKTLYWGLGTALLFQF